MAISCNSIGAHGRLGNQMFQYAALRGIASKHGHDFFIPPSNFKDVWQEHQLFQGFELAGLEQRQIRLHAGVPRLAENHFHFDATLFETCPDHVDIVGNFQTEKYFSHIADAIRRDFTFKAPILAKAKAFRQLFPGAPVVSLHVRRGDYLQLPWHPCCPIAYYEQALSRLDPKLPVIVFTDDPDWVRQQPLFGSGRFHLSSGNSNLTDLCLMALCDYHIIANSSFSWWGAWLANSKQTVAPSLWFGPPLDQQYSTIDIIPARWEKLCATPSA